MRAIILLILISISSFLTAQKDTSGSINSYDLYYGSRPSFQNFYNQLNTTNKFEFSRPIQIIGIGTSGRFPVTRDGSICGHFIYNQIIPQSIYINDTIKCKITGFNFSFAHGDVISTKSERFALFYYAGFNTGRLRIYGNQLASQKNFYFSPKIGIQPKISYKNFAISFILECEYDITNPNWKHTLFSNREQTKINKIRQSGVTGQIGIGYAIH